MLVRLSGPVLFGAIIVSPEEGSSVNPTHPPVSAGLTFVGTPIGNARDITLRALDVLEAADVLAAEDTRALRRLMEIHGIALRDRPLIAYHDHNGAKVRPRLLAELHAGRTVAYASEAGMPLIADPGYGLMRAAIDEDIPITVAPGPVAAATALALGGLPTDRFFFAGFLPNSASARRKALTELVDVPGTLVFYESPKRVAAMLKDAAEVLGSTRSAALCRELTKRFEEVRRASLEDLAQDLGEHPVKGEIVVIIGPGHSGNINESDISEELARALESHSVRDAADLIARAHGLNRRKVYQMALALEQTK